MTTEAPIEQRRVWKVGRGFELTIEALVEVLADRFPNAIDWDNLPGPPQVDYSIQTGHFGLYWVQYIETDEYTDEMVAKDLSANPIRRIGEGAPIPSLCLQVRSVLRDDQVQRCGWMLEAGKSNQCTAERGHDGEHVGEA